jgi:transcriptional regulator with XRE-family HTH domain
MGVSMSRLVERTDFGEKLKAAREAAGLTQEQLAERAGVYLHVVSKMERGVREPTWPTALKFAKALGVSVAAFEGELLGDGSKESRPRGRPRKAAEGPAPTPKRPRGRPRKESGGPPEKRK